MQDIINDINSSIKTFKELLQEGGIAAIAYSSGKDSETCLGLFINACLQLKREGKSIEQQYLVTSDTLIENPEVDSLKKAKLKQLAAFCELNGIPLEIVETKPALLQTWQYKVIGGRVLPTTVNSTHRQCSKDLKIIPNTKALKEIKKSLPFFKRHKLFTVLGSRDSESAIRAKNISKIKGSSSALTTNEQGESFFYPIKEYTVDHVWYFLARSGRGKNKLWMSYAKSHDETINLYKDSGGECVMVQTDTNEDGVTTENQSSCGARHGCWQCQAMGGSGDKSMENLIETESGEYMKPLNDIRNYVAKASKDYSLRRPIGRTLREGYMKLQPDCFSGSLCRDLLKASMTADYNEKVRAASVGEKPKFQIITLEQLIAIDWAWSVNAMFKRPFEALKVYQEVYRELDFLYLSDYEPQTIKMPKAKYLYLGDSWYQEHFNSRGLVNLTRELVGDDTQCGERTELVSEKGSKQFESPQHADSFQVDMESANLMLEFELERLLEMRSDYNSNRAVEFYLSYGIISIPSKMIKKYDEMIARGQAYRELGFDEAALSFNDVGELGEENPLFTNLRNGLDKQPMEELGAKEHQLSLFG